MLNKHPVLILLFFLSTMVPVIFFSVKVRSEVLPALKFHASEGSVTVHTDISEEFARAHSRHGRQVWEYFSKKFARSPGNRVVLYYTKNQNLYDGILKKYPTITMKGARQLTANWTGDHREWFIIPYTEPDFGTQIHELGHDFLYATFPGSESFPWFKEGTGMYFESGTFDANGILVIKKPIPSYHRFFKELAAQKKLIPLNKLVRMTKNEFYRADYTKTYSQSMILVFYLENRHPAAMRQIYSGINSRRITENEQILALIQRSAAKSFEELDNEYIEFGTAGI